MIALATPRLFDGTTMLGPRTVLIEDGRIAAIADHAPAGVAIEALAADAVLAPGFVDLQVNGGDGVLFNDSPDAEGLRRIAAAHARLGTTALLPTLVSAPRALRQAAMAAARAALAAGIPGIVGLHLEGPFIAPSRRGIHPLAHLGAPTAEEIAELCAPFPGPLLLTLAPEIVAAADVAALAAAGRRVFLGHSAATIAQAAAALAAGAAGFTHLFNAMSQILPREPGMVGAALDSADAAAGIIIDALHVHPAAIRLAFAALGPQRLFLVSDAMPTVGQPDAAGFVLHGRPIRLQDGRLTDADGTLAGAHLAMADAVRIAVQQVGLDLSAALRMATATPAGVLGLHDHGRIAPGARADLVALDAALRVVRVWQAGVALA